MPTDLVPVSPKPRSQLQLLDCFRPIVPEKPGERPIGKDPSSGLAAGTVVALIVRVNDVLHRCAAHRAWLSEFPVYGHLGTKRSDLLGKGVSGLTPEPPDPFLQYRLCGMKETRNFIVRELLRLAKR